MSARSTTARTIAGRRVRVYRRRVRAGASAVVNNIFYAIGRANNGQLSVVEAYDPAANAWSTRAPLPFILESMQAVVEDNIIYVVGGFNSGGGRLTSTLSYSPSTNAWSMLAPLKVGKSDSATGLLGATIVSAGGLGSSAVITDTEVTTPPPTPGRRLRRYRPRVRRVASESSGTNNT
jgi:hypothetical protein